MTKRLAILILLVTALPAAAAEPTKRELLAEMFAALRSPVPPDASEIDTFERHLSSADIRAVIAFFATPAGQHLAAATEEINNAALQSLEAAIAGSKRKRTMADLQTLGVAVEAYAIDYEDKYPVATDLDALSRAIAPTYVRSMIRLDGWGKEYIYVTDTANYRIVSAGPDGQLGPDSRKLNASSGNFGDDLIFENGEFIQPKESQ